MWEMADLIGYKPITTFWQDFSIADVFGAAAVNDTARRVWDEWHNDYKMITEMIMVLNHKSWFYAEKNTALCTIYSDLYYFYDAEFLKEFENNKEALSYYFKITD